jgi:hypothetical protein
VEPYPAESEPVGDEGGQEDGNIWAELGAPMLREVVAKMEVFDYEAVFEFLRSQSYSDFFCYELSGISMPGMSFGSESDTGDDRGYWCSYWGGTDGSDKSFICARPGTPYTFPENTYDANGSGALIYAVRYGGVSYMLAGEFVNGVAEGAFTIYEQRDLSTDTTKITRLMARGDVFAGEAVIEIYENGEHTRAYAFNEDSGFPVPMEWAEGLSNDFYTTWRPFPSDMRISDIPQITH